MAVTYLSPGVYVEEVDRGTKPIQAVGTSTAAFIGLTAEASRKAIDPNTGNRVVVENRLNKSTLVSSWTQFVDIFGDFVPGAYLPDAVYGYFANGGGPCYIVSLRTLREGGEEPELAEVNIPSKGKGTSFTIRSKSLDLQNDQPPIKIESAVEDTFNLSVGDETLSGLTMKRGGENYVGNASFKSVTIENVGPASAIPADGSYTLRGGEMQALGAGEFIGDVTERTGLASLEALDDVRLIAMPDLMAGYDGTPEARERIKTVQEALIAHCKRLRYRFAVLDTPPGLNAQQVMEWHSYVNFDSSYAAMYYPWIYIADLGSMEAARKLVPPSGHMLGIYNRTDADRGVHKAPANDVVAGALDLELQISKGEQELLNPKGINCIRAFPGRGIRIWGARTLSSDGAWRYVSVRRLFITVEASLDAGMQWVVFEPNDRTLWAKVRRDATSFLKTFWLSGALFGNTPEEAFYVKCDEDLNNEDIRKLGQLIIEVGLAPVKPAEFVIFRITQWVGANAEP